MSRRAETTVNYLFIALFTVIVLVPVIAIIFMGLRAPSQQLPSLAPPDPLSVASLRAAWIQGHFAEYMRSSLIVSASVVGATAVFSILAGYAFATMRFRGHNTLFYILLLGLVVPTEAIVIPLYYDFRAAGLTDTYWALILPQVGLSVAFGTFWMRAFFRATPRTLIEAARVEGAPTRTILWRVLLPIATPAVLTMVLLIFLWTWNEFLLALVMVTSENVRTAPLGLATFQGRYTANYSLLSAASIIVAIPVVVLFIALQRHFIRGMLSGALKL